jgi:hypothetical protein
MKGASAVTASSTGGSCSAKGAAMAGGSCSAHGNVGAAMTAGSCSAHGNVGAEMTAGACPHGAKGAAAHAMTAGTTHSCGRASTMATGGASCPSGAGVMSGRHAGCSFCDELTACDQEMRSLGAVSQVVPLKNGVMFVYTGDASKVRSVQSAMARRKDQTAIFASNDPTEHLCSGCKALRGAAASGKLSREVVNIDSGCLTLMTSSDPAIVARIHELAGVPTTRIKI